ncbi:MAG: VWA domain-containing protein [Proteobacteria bacterium]|nr:VWA domain-containing protein [Pseudomonadota bacterium]MBU1641503.1 VWA domain-containing protein [Pseudomonadota bacterium]
MDSSSDHSTAQKLYGVIPAIELNSWESEELLDCLTELSDSQQDFLLHQISVIWPVSHSLCLAFLEAVRPALSCLDKEQFATWVRGILDRYESQGLQEARRFMHDLDNHFICTLKGQTGLLLSTIKNRLSLYLRGVAGRPFDLETAPLPGTDTTSIFLPRNSTLFGNVDANFLVYKLLASLQWAFIRGNLYCHEVDDEEALFAKLGRPMPSEPCSAIFLTRFFDSFAKPETAKAIYHFLQSFRALAFLQKRLPGLMRDSQIYFRTIAAELSVNLHQNELLSAEYAFILKHLCHNLPLELPSGPGWHECRPSAWWQDRDLIFVDTNRIYATSKDSSDRPLAQPPYFLGSFLVDKAHARRLSRRKEVEQQFIEALSIRILPALSKKDAKSPQESPTAERPQQPDSGANLTIRLPEPPDDQDKIEPIHDRVVRHIRLDDQKIDLDHKLQELGREIMDDLGNLPQLYIDSAAQMAAGRSYEPNMNTPEQEGTALKGALLYDEWDFRRQGFRHDWCHLLEKNIHPSGGTFISSALSEHRGVIKQLKRQFEQMRSHHRFVGRQRDGDDIDLDALTEALADRQAGLPPSERLFVRQLRDQRDIAALFLVDMSSSTEGWVGKAIKESLLVMAEAMESLGDRYAIYGFSGMRRTRSEVFRVKEMEEPYNETVQGRIAALGPKDYTRMGPPIRHFSKILAKVEARIRLLIILTDGKPEDYDDYKGEYAIEDTRHALIEAKNAGIHPFCITIDHKAQDYISHLFGEVNYLFIDDVKKLPRRMPDMYRILTS